MPKSPTVKSNSITKLTTNQIDDIVNAAYADSVGETGDISKIDITPLVDEGTADVAALRSKFTGKLLAAVRDNFFTQTSAEEEYSDPFYKDEAEFGAIMQMISCTVPEAKENSAWQDFVSGTTKVGQYTVYLPTIDTTYFTKKTAWAVPLTLTGEQWDDAFKDRAGLRRFTDFIFLCLQNGILKHRENMNELNRNNFIAQKFGQLTGVSVINLAEKYATERGETSWTVEQALASDDFKAFAMSLLGEYAGYMRKQTSLFTADGSVRFTPESRLVVQVLNKFDKALAVTKSGIYHNEFIKMPKYDTVAAWQGVGELSFHDLSEINVETSSGVVNQSGIVAFMADSWAIMHTIRKQRIGEQYFSIEDVHHYEFQFVDAYMNNLNMPAIVFTLQDYTHA